MDEILNVALKLFAMFLLAIGSLLIKRFLTYINSKLKSADDAETAQLISDFVAAAEQTLKAYDPDGTKRLAYVEQLVSAAGYELNDIMKSKIESAVYAINKSTPAKSKDITLDIAE